MKHYWDREVGEWVEYDPIALRAERAKRPMGIMLHRDLPAYKSPLGDGVIEGRTARREHFKRTGTREVEKGEFTPVYHSQKRAAQTGGRYEERPAIDLPDDGTFKRGF